MGGLWLIPRKPLVRTRNAMDGRPLDNFFANFIFCLFLLGREANISKCQSFAQLTAQHFNPLLLLWTCYIIYMFFIISMNDVFVGLPCFLYLLRSSLSNSGYHRFRDRYRRNVCSFHETFFARWTYLFAIVRTVCGFVRYCDKSAMPARGRSWWRGGPGHRVAGEPVTLPAINHDDCYTCVAAANSIWASRAPSSRGSPGTGSYIGNPPEKRRPSTDWVSISIFSHRSRKQRKRKPPCEDVALQIT